jgi:hypothetical protein
MKPIRSATLAAQTERGVVLDCGNGITCRISLLGAAPSSIAAGWCRRMARRTCRGKGAIG